MRFVPAETSIFDMIAGLPVHPLVVHFAVVILPLAALLQAVLVFVPRWRPRWATPTLVGLVAGTGFALVAKQSGEALAAHVGNPRTHALWGDILPPVAVVLVLVSGAWWYLQRRDARPAAHSGVVSLPTLVAGLMSAALAVATTVITVVVGHSGAQAAWGGRLDAAAAVPAATASSTSTAKASSAKTTSSSTSGALTLAAVQQHAAASSCWSVVNGYVYDLTAWIDAHPGGPGVIQGMCGTDATSNFTDKHGGQNRPEAYLTTFRLGKLVG